MDADFVIALIESDSFNIVTDIGLGYFVRSWFQPVIEAAYSFENPNHAGFHKLKFFLQLVDSNQYIKNIHKLSTIPI
ncbi:MAG: hypothetical protein ACREOB_01195 [Thermodesulfobacteriota bacterium]